MSHDRGAAVPKVRRRQYLCRARTIFLCISKKFGVWFGTFKNKCTKASYSCKKQFIDKAKSYTIYMKHLFWQCDELFTRKKEISIFSNRCYRMWRNVISFKNYIPGCKPSHTYEHYLIQFEKYQLDLKKTIIHIAILYVKKIIFCSTAFPVVGWYQT